MKLCQGPKCHEHKTKDRIRGPKGDKHYETRRRSHLYYNNEFCSLNCQDDWLRIHGERAIDHFGRLHEPKRIAADSAWYKSYKYNYNNGNDSNYDHYFVNDLLGQRIPITEQQYDDKDLVRPD